MFVLKATTGLVATAHGAVFYTGRAGAGWIATRKAEAFRYETLEGAERAAERHNKWERLHGFRFEAVAA